MTGLSSVQVGDEIMANLYGTRYSPVTVTKIGRKYLEAGGARFEIATGSLAGPYTGYALTLEDYAKEQHRESLIRALRDLGVTFTYPTEPSTAQLEAIQAILRGEVSL